MTTTVSFDLLLFAEAAKVLRSIPERTSVPIHSHALMEADGEGGMRLTMTDFDLTGRVEIDGCEAEAPIAAALPRPVLDFIVTRASGVSGAPEDHAGRFVFDDEMSQVTVHHRRARMTHSILSAADFPPFEAREPAYSFELPGHEFCRLLHTCEKAVPDDDHRYFLLGVYLHATGDTLAAVGLDGYRLHFDSTERPDGAEKMPGVIVPKKTLGEIVRAFGDEEGALTVSGDVNQITVAAGRITLRSKLIEGNFPDYAKLIPEPGADRVTVAAAEIGRAVQALKLIPKTEAKGKTAAKRAVRLARSEDGILEIAMKGDDGDAEDRLSVKSEGKPFEYAVDVRYLLDALAACPAGDVTLAHSAHKNHRAVRIMTADDRKRFVVMDMVF